MKMKIFCNMLGEIGVGLNFLGAIRPESNMREYIVSAISPEKKYAKLYDVDLDKYIWASMDDIGMFEKLG